ncbi:MAG: glutamyl-tRNA reductase [Gammaproteobacteria bacterium]|nr:glutamyl-tRNA reductase [Gammaproteobacteria bacterium]MDH5176752.1 glutamyl-tRNA reductase [Gammaproteobacteria bacterium]MDH5227325.1 glutamyl-tRNA reductase [Gammaproteobacteria bacterium]
MSLVVVGINHRTAPVEVRERVVFEPARIPEALQQLRQIPAVHETVIVSTCNRTELYCVTDNLGQAELGEWLQRYHGIGISLDHSLYHHNEQKAVSHAFSVASGLDSMVLGEPQILGQLKDAYRVAQEAGTTGPVLNRLFQSAFSVAKRVRTETKIGANAVSVASAAVAMARTVFASFENRTALFVGAGETVGLAARHLYADGLRRMIIANRSVDRARELAAEFHGFAIGLDEIPNHLKEADIVVASTAAPHSIITRHMTEQALRARKRKPMFMVDIAVPRDIDADVAELEDVYLFTVDDLQSVVNENLEGRRQAAREANELIQSEVERFTHTLRTRDAAPVIRRLREEAERTRQRTLEQARQMLSHGKSQDEVLNFLANTLTNRLIHAPSQRLRDAAETGDGEIIETIADIYRLDQPHD